MTYPSSTLLAVRTSSECSAALETARPFSHFTLQSNSRCSSVTHMRSIQLKDYHRASFTFSLLLFFVVFFFLFWRNSFDCWRRLLQLLFCICGLRPCTLLFNLCFYSFTALTRLSFARLLRRIKHVTICGASLSAERGKKVFWDAAVELCMCVQKMRWWRVPLDGRLTARINCQTLLLLLLLLLLLPAPLLVPTPPP